MHKNPEHNVAHIVQIWLGINMLPRHEILMFPWTDAFKKQKVLGLRDDLSSLRFAI